MPAEINERDLTFTFRDALSVERFDDDTTHGMGHRMKRVDFVVAFPNETWLIEVKDPENRIIPAHLKQAQLDAFRKKMHSETLYGRELAPKLRDTLVYLSLAHRSPINKITFICVISIATLDAAMLLTALNKLERSCYLPGPFKRPWASNFSVLVLNMDAWNEKLHPHSVRRL